MLLFFVSNSNMKTVLVILLVCCIFVTSNAFPGMETKHISQRKTFSNKVFERKISSGVAQQVEKLRNLINKGDAALGIPVLDPFKHANANIVTETPGLHVVLSAQIITITGMGHFELSDVEIVTTPNLGVRFAGLVPLTTLHMNRYSAVVTVNDTRYIGNGVADFEGDNLSFSGDAKITDGLKGAILKDFKLNLKLGKMKSSLTGMMGGTQEDDKINAIIGEKGADFFNKNSDLLANLIGEKMLLNLNKLLVGTSSDDLVKLITG